MVVLSSTPLQYSMHVWRNMLPASFGSLLVTWTVGFPCDTRDYDTSYREDPAKLQGAVLWVQVYDVQNGYVAAIYGVLQGVQGELSLHICTRTCHGIHQGLGVAYLDHIGEWVINPVPVSTSVSLPCPGVRSLSEQPSFLGHGEGLPACG